MGKFVMKPAKIWIQTSGGFHGRFFFSDSSEKRSFTRRLSTTKVRTVYQETAVHFVARPPMPKLGHPAK
jgi:hypothetical protein